MASRGRYAKGEAKRREILDAALETVAVNGSRRTRISEIAERVGLTQAGLMHYFRTREELYLAVLGARDIHDRDVFANQPPGIEGFLAVIEHNRDVPGLSQLYAEFSAEATHSGHPSREFFLDRYRYLRGALQRDVEYAMSTGEMGPYADPGAIADLMIAAADGLQVQWLLDRDVDVVGRLRKLWKDAAIASHRPG